MPNEVLENIHNLEKKAKEILDLKQNIEQRRPIVIEFCGSPKSGKTTCITALNIFLKRNGFNTFVLTERANLCPVSQKTHPFFNIWTMCSAIAQLIEHLSKFPNNLDVIIADRAVFDALCWFGWLNNNPSKASPHLDDAAYKILQEFLTLKMIARKIDLIYIFKASPKTSLTREYANLLTRKTGSIMNKEVLEGYCEALDICSHKYVNFYRSIETIDTTSLDQNTVNYNVTDNILDILRNILEENIGYIENDIVNKLKVGINNFSVIQNEQLNFGLRTNIENREYIQPIPMAVFTNSSRDKVLVLKKNNKSVSKKSPEKNKLLLYAGGHIRKEDAEDSNSIFEIIRNALYREIQEELNESITINSGCECFLVYSTDYEKSKKHLGICFVITMNLDNVGFKPSRLEFIEKSGKTKNGMVLSLKEIIDSDEQIDSWSLFILEHVFNVFYKNKSLNQFPINFDLE